MVERRQLWLTQALNQGENGGIDEANAQVGVGCEQIAHPAIVLVQQILYDERSRIDLIEDQREPIAGKPPAKPVHLRQHWRGYDSRLTCFREQTYTHTVIVVARIQGGVENAGV